MSDSDNENDFGEWNQNPPEQSLTVKNKIEQTQTNEFEGHSNPDLVGNKDGVYLKEAQIEQLNQLDKKASILKQDETESANESLKNKEQIIEVQQGHNFQAKHQIAENQQKLENQVKNQIQDEKNTEIHEVKNINTLIIDSSTLIPLVVPNKLELEKQQEGDLWEMSKGVQFEQQEDDQFGQFMTVTEGNQEILQKPIKEFEIKKNQSKQKEEMKKIENQDEFGEYTSYNIEEKSGNMLQTSEMMSFMESLPNYSMISQYVE